MENTPELFAALGPLVAGYSQRQRGVLKEAYMADKQTLLSRISWARGNTEAPAGAIYNKAKEIVQIKHQIDELGVAHDRGNAEKRVRSALNYSQTSLGCIPLDEQEADVREQFPWITEALLRECLERGRSAFDAQLADEARVLAEADIRRKEDAK